MRAQSCPILCTSWTLACQAPVSMGLSRQEYWSGWPFPSPGDLPDPVIEPQSPASYLLHLQADSLPLCSETPFHNKVIAILYSPFVSYQTFFLHIHIDFNLINASLFKKLVKTE